MASTSSYFHPTPASSSSQSYINYDVFLSFRGEDIRKTFVDHLYSALEGQMISTYKDDKSLRQSESIRPSLLKAIEGSHIALIIFSKNYADSSWCLDELEHIMKCKDERELTVMPIFYGVTPSEVRKQEGDFGKGFAKHEDVNSNRVQSWRKSLVGASNIAGWDLENIANGYESKAIKEIVDKISNHLSSLTSGIDEDLVGMRARLQELEAQLEIGSNDVRMVGIWGLGGSGKTTLATSLYMKISRHFQGHCVIENIREESRKHGLLTLQEKILTRISKPQMTLQSIGVGKQMIKSRLSRSNVLIVLDDVDDCDQLDALAGSHNWFGSGSRIIITTRDEHLLKTHRVDHVYPIRLLSHEEAIQFFNKKAYNEKIHVKFFETLSLNVLSYAAGLPLALKVLGSFLYDKDEKEWMSSLDRLRVIPEIDIIKVLKISYDGLKTVEKELFLDIACFFRGESIDDAMEIFEACGYYPDIGIKVLREKALITIKDGKFDMHDMVQEMGHYIVRGESPNNPEEHSRVWEEEDINKICLGDVTKENDKTEVIHFGCFDPFYRIVSNMKKLKCLRVRFNIRSFFMNGIKYDYSWYEEGSKFLSNELRYIDLCTYPRSPFPDSWKPMNLATLKLCNNSQTELWNGYKLLPHLKVLELREMEYLLSTPDFDGLPCLQKFRLEGCGELEEIHPSLGNHTSLECICIKYCKKLRSFPVIAHMRKLKLLDLSYCQQLVELPELPSNLAILQADGCKSLTTIGDFKKECKWLCHVSLMYGSKVNDGSKLLESMLQGKAIEYDQCMVLALEGVEIAKGFIPPLVLGTNRRLELPKNWHIDFCGFLICLVTNDMWCINIGISMEKVMGGMDSEDDVVWKADRYDDEWVSTFVCYVPFVSLRHTASAWWDNTTNVVSFSCDNYFGVEEYCSGFGVRLVARKSGSSPIQTSTQQESEFSHYRPDFYIRSDSQHALKNSLYTKLPDSMGRTTCFRIFVTPKYISPLMIN